MNEFMIGMGTALWLGILTSISPCPLATNIAAISYIGRKVGNSRQIFLTGLLYTLGRTLAYLGLAFILVASVLSMPQISLFLQKYMSLSLGPILIIVGMFLLGMIQMDIAGQGMGEGLKKAGRCNGHLGCPPAGHRFRFVVLPNVGSIVFRQSYPTFLEGELQHCTANHLWHRHRFAGHGFCCSPGH